MRRHSILAAAVLAVAAALAPLSAQADTAKDYNLFVLGAMSAQGSDTEGRVAVGGNASLQSYSVADKASASTVNLVVKGNLTANGGSTVGKTIVGGTASYTNWSTAGLQPPGTPLPVDFPAEAIRLKDLSAALAGRAPNGSTAYQNWGAPAGSHGYQITLTGNNAGLNVFNVDGIKAFDANTFTINLAPGSTALINVTGFNDGLLNMGLTINGTASSNVLWNFADATSLSFRGVGMLGSVLAPNAAYTGSGVINGQLLVGSYTGSWAGGATQVNKVMYTGGLLDPVVRLQASVPEPATWAMMIMGFGFVGAALRRRRGARLAV